MKPQLRCLLLLCFFLVCGCGQTITVHRAVKPPSSTTSAASDPARSRASTARTTGTAEQVERVKGMPFYIKKGGCQHHTSWLQPIYTLTLTITFTPDKPAGDTKTFTIAQTVTMPLWLYDSEDAAQLRALLSQGNPTPPKTDQEKADQEKHLEDVVEKWDELVTQVAAINYKPFGMNEDKLSVCDKDANRNELPNCEAKQVVKLENVTEPVLYVDYSTPYYYNSSKPLIGSSQASFKQASDGTLSEGSAQVETKTLQSFLDLFPVKDLVSTAAGTAKAAAALRAGPAETSGTYKLELTTAVKVYKHTHTAQISTGPPPCPTPDADVIGSGAYNLTIEDVGQSADKKSADANTITVNGSIKLPKSADSGTQSQKPVPKGGVQ